MTEIISTQSDYLMRLKEASERAGALAKQCLVPIVHSDAQRDIEVVGSALYLEYEDAKYLVTASHVIPENDKSVYYIPSKKGLQAIGGYTMRMASSGSIEDRHDIFAIAIPDELLETFASFQPAEIADEHLLRALEQDENIALFGYPNSWNRKFKRDLMEFSIKGLTERTAKIEEYSKEGYSLDVNILINFDKKNCYTIEGMHKEYPDPYGISGGGIWRLFGRRDLYRSIEPYLVGVLIEKTQNSKFLVGAKLGCIINTVSALRKVVLKSRDTPNALSETAI